MRMRKYGQPHPLYSNLSPANTCSCQAMPEGPELCMNSRFVNNVCRGRIFNGKVVKSTVSKCCDVDFASEAYTITSEARGKEVALTLQCTLDPQNKLRLLFRFGMSGKFRFSPLKELPKHAHLQFFSKSPEEGKTEIINVLSFVDVRRFGSWHVTPGGWGENRGPDPMFEYDAFRSNVLENLDDPAFNRPICEALLNQKYFNGIGNYLRAEILFRVGVPPFTCARKVLETVCESESEPVDGKNDILLLCHTVPQEVVNLKQKLGKSESSAVTGEDYVAFCQWLKCYENPDMKNVRDHNGRTIWFKGEAGAMCPRSKKDTAIQCVVFDITDYTTDQKSRRLRRSKNPAYKAAETAAQVKEECEVAGVNEESEGIKGECEDLAGVKEELSEALEGVKDISEGGDKSVKRQGTKKRERTVAQSTEPSAKRNRLQVKTKLTGTKSKLCAALPTRRSSRLKNSKLTTLPL